MYKISMRTQLLPTTSISATLSLHHSLLSRLLPQISNEPPCFHISFCLFSSHYSHDNPASRSHLSLTLPHYENSNWFRNGLNGPVFWFPKLLTLSPMLTPLQPVSLLFLKHGPIPEALYCSFLSPQISRRACTSCPI